MKQNKTKGMRTCRYHDESAERKGGLLSAVVAAIASIALIVLITGLAGIIENYISGVMLITAVIVTVACGIMTKLNKKNLLCLLMPAAMLLMVICCGRMILNGGCIFWNHMGDAVTAGNGIVIRAVEAGSADGNETLNLLTFSVFSGAVIAFVCWIIASVHGYILAIVLPVLALAGVMIFSIEGSFTCITLCLVAGICILAVSGIKDDGIKGALGKIVPIILLCLVMVSITGTEKIDQWTNDTSVGVRERIHAFRYETEYTTLPEGQFADYMNNDGQSQPALVVTMEQPEEMYLRGFTAAEFKNERWYSLDNKILAENEELLYWLNREGWNPQTQFYGSASATAKSGKEPEELLKNITVQNLNACSKYLYVPYSLSGSDYLDAENISPDGVLSGNDRMYTYSVLPDGTDRISGIMAELNEADKESTEEYRLAEGSYREFVYDYYLHIPDEISQQMMPLWEAFSAEDDEGKESNAAAAQVNVRCFLEQTFPEDADASELVLPLDIAKGSSYQYATVAVMTLRYYGIPARYAEGYIITDEMAEAAENNDSIQVDSSCAAAWAEVYHDGIGWIPMALTPGIEDLSSSNDGNQNGDLPQEMPAKTEIPEDEPEQNDEPEPKGGSVVGVEKIVSLTFLVFIALIVVLVMILTIRRHLILKHRSQRWDDADINAAVAGIFADAVPLLKILGFDRGNKSMRNLAEPIKDTLGEAYADLYETVVDVNSRAMFSSKILGEEQRGLLKEFYSETVQHLINGSKWYRKLWMQWVLCLY